MNPNTQQNQSEPPKSISLLGCRIDCVTMSQTLEFIKKAIEERKPKQIITADASGLVTAQSDEEFMNLLKTADLITPDSAGILWAAKRRNNPLPERVSGVDIVLNVCRLSHEKGWRLFFFGSAEGVAEMAAKNLTKQFPNLQIAGIRNGFFTQDETANIVALIKEASPDVLFVALGIPKQEKWIAAHKDELNIPVSIGVGGSFDVFAGLVKRAPKWMQSMSLEWLWRLMQNPRKIGKVMTLPRFVLMTLKKR